MNHTGAREFHGVTVAVTGSVSPGRPVHALVAVTVSVSPGGPVHALRRREGGAR